MKCSLYNGEHWLSQCKKFKKKPVEERFKLVCSLKLSDNCLTVGHVARYCEKRNFCKIEGCKVKHSTFLHRKASNITEEKPKSSQNEKEISATEQGPNVKEKNGQNGYVKVRKKRRVTKCNRYVLFHQSNS